MKVQAGQFCACAVSFPFSDTLEVFNLPILRVVGLGATVDSTMLFDVVKLPRAHVR